MNEAYSEYLNSNAWQDKRVRRLNLGKHRCAACSSKRDLDIHHLTYERIYNENMEDLLPLCRACHNAAEALVSTGRIPRTGDPARLAVLTIRLLDPRASAKVKNRPPCKTNGFRPKNSCQERLLIEPCFIQALALPRGDFKKFVNSRWPHKYGSFRMRANAFTLYSKRKRLKPITQEAQPF